MIKVILAEFPMMIRPDLFQDSMMCSVTASPHTKSLWILCVVLSVAAGGEKFLFQKFYVKTKL